MAERTGQIEALMAAGVGVLSALVARVLLTGVYSAHQEQYAALKWLDAAVLLVGVLTAGLTYRLLRGRARR